MFRNDPCAVRGRVGQVGLGGSGVASRRRAVGYEATQASTVPREELVECVDQAAGVDGAQSVGDRPGEAYLSEERNAPARVAS